MVISQNCFTHLRPVSFIVLSASCLSIVLNTFMNRERELNVHTHAANPLSWAGPPTHAELQNGEPGVTTPRPESPTHLPLIHLRRAKKKPIISFYKRNCCSSSPSNLQEFKEEDGRPTGSSSTFEL